MGQTRIWIVVLAFVGAGLTHWFTSRFNISIFNLVYIVVIAQMVLLPVILTVLFGHGGERRFGFASIVAGMVTGVGLVAHGISTHNAGLLPWTPAVALAVSALVWLPTLFTPRAKAV